MVACPDQGPSRAPRAATEAACVSTWLGEVVAAREGLWLEASREPQGYAGLTLVRATFVGLQPTVIASRASPPLLEQSSFKESWTRVARQSNVCLTLRPIFTFNNISLGRQLYAHGAAALRQRARQLAGLRGSSLRGSSLRFVAKQQSLRYPGNRQRLAKQRCDRNICLKPAQP